VESTDLKKKKIFKEFRLKNSAPRKGPLFISTVRTDGQQNTNIDCGIQETIEMTRRHKIEIIVRF
jgi:hypothetical protein